METRIAALWQMRTTQRAGEHFLLPCERVPRGARFWQTAPDWLEAIAQVRFGPTVSLLGLLLTPVAVVAGALGAWRFGADAGWTNTFFIADGLLSHWQVWCAFAFGLQACAHTLKLGMTDRELRTPALIRVKSLSGRRETKGTL